MNAPDECGALTTDQLLARINNEPTDEASGHVRCLAFFELTGRLLPRVRRTTRGYAAKWMPHALATARTEEAAELVRQNLAAKMREGALPKFGNVEYIANYMIRSVLNAIRDLLRHERLLLLAARSDTTDPRQPEPIRDEIEAETRDETVRNVRSGLKLLDPQMRLMLRLRYVEGWRLRDIADCFGLAHGTLHSRMSRALDTLRQHITQQLDASG